MNDPLALDLSALSQFRASDLLEVAGCAASSDGSPRQVALDAIEFDPAQPRRGFKEDSLEELSVSVRRHGVLEPVSLRSHPEGNGRFIVNRGERRVRAARRAGLTAVPAFIDERIDPFAQAAENLHREDMSPFDLAVFIAEREKEGLARAEIARRLAKPRSFITEAAKLAAAPDELRQAVESGRLGADVRTLYRLVGIARERPEAVTALLAGQAEVNRSSVDEVIGRAAPPAQLVDSVDSPGPVHQPAIRSSKIPSGGRTVLVVEHAGRRGSLRLKAQDSDVGEVRFSDGTRTMLPLADLRPVCWATEEAR